MATRPVARATANRLGSQAVPRRGEQAVRNGGARDERRLGAARRPSRQTRDPPLFRRTARPIRFPFSKPPVVRRCPAPRACRAASASSRALARTGTSCAPPADARAESRADAARSRRARRKTGKEAARHRHARVATRKDGDVVALSETVEPRFRAVASTRSRRLNMSRSCSNRAPPPGARRATRRRTAALSAGRNHSTPVLNCMCQHPSFCRSSAWDRQSVLTATSDSVATRSVLKNGRGSLSHTVSTSLTNTSCPFRNRYRRNAAFNAPICWNAFPRIVTFAFGSCNGCPPVAITANVYRKSASEWNGMPLERHSFSVSSSSAATITLSTPNPPGHVAVPVQRELAEPVRDKRRKHRSVGG